MKLSKVEIKNFRSIENLVIEMDPTCQIFVGINESGKSNILKAISLLNRPISFSNDDIRLEGKIENPIEIAFIKYHFKFNKNDREILLERIISKLFATSPSSEEVKMKRDDMLLKFINSDLGYYLVDFLKKEENVNRYESFSEQGDMVEEIDFLENILDKEISEYILENLPKVVYWKYDETFLLPSTINLSQFEHNPTMCPPLQSMFYLAGYKDITKTIGDSRSGRRSTLENKIENVAQKSTQYLNDVWKDYGKIELVLTLDGENLNIRIQDEENKYDCDQRSDGFKRFISFLLALAAKVKHGELENSVIIIDEPDTGLHISGQKYLTEELIKMSEKNLVLFSTHSIFMIDKNQPDRHFIVKKNKEKTIVERVKKSNITDDEVIYRALGYSTFETLRENNLIFEGWSDKKIFNVILDSNDLRIPEAFKTFGLTFAKGVSDITPIAKVLELADRKYFVISDSDEAAKRSHKEYLEQQRCAGQWYMYNDIIPNIYTLEDFIKHNAFKKPIESVRQKKPQLTAEFDYNLFSKTNFKRVEAIKSWVKECTNSDSKEIKEIMTEIKNELYNTISVNDVEDLYYDFVSALFEKIKNKN